MTDRTRKWTLEDRTAAYQCYYRSGSRAQVRKELGVPERTLTAWLNDARFDDEREAVRAGILMAIREEAMRRGRELADATSEAILVCRKALRRDPDGKTASSLLSSLMRAREVEDRIHRLDEGGPTSIAGVKLSADDRAAFEEWLEDRRENQHLTREQLVQALRASSMEVIGRATLPGEAQLLHDVLATLVQCSADTLMSALRGDLPLVLRLWHVVELARVQAEADADLSETQRAAIAAPRPGSEHESGAPRRHPERQLRDDLPPHDRNPLISGEAPLDGGESDVQ